VEASAGIEQPLRWQGRLYTALAGGMYDVRAREWSPQLGVFTSADEFQYLTTAGRCGVGPGRIR
jgi:RHS repeat-associated protein